MAKGGKSGKGGGGDSGGDGTSGGSIRGTNRNDLLQASLDGSLIDGRRGDDTVVFEGSVLDYTYSYDSLGRLVVTNDVGSNVLASIESITFDDLTYDRGEENLATWSIEPVVVTMGELSTFTVTWYDPDPSASGTVRPFDETSITFTEVSRTERQLLDGTYKTITYETELGRTTERLMLAEGETRTEIHYVAYSEGRSNYSGMPQTTFEITVVGVNDAPVIPTAFSNTVGGPQHKIDAVEDGGIASFSIAPWAFDYDSDDSSDTLGVQIVSADPRLDLWVEGGTVYFDPGSDFQDLSTDESITYEILIRAVDRHGAVSEIRPLDVTINGAFDPLPQIYGPDGIDFAAAGVDFTDAEGPLLTWRSQEDGTTSADLEFGDGDDTLTFEGWAFGGFKDYYILQPDDTHLVYRDALNFGDGDDTGAFRFRSSDQEQGAVTFAENEIDMGDGADTLLIEMKSMDDAEFVRNDIEMGFGRDHLILDIEAQGSAIQFSNDIWMGVGDDLVEVYASSPDRGTNSIGSFSIGSDWDLGFGQDTFIFDVDTDESFSAGFRGTIDARLGDDYVRLDSRGSAGESSFGTVYDKAGLDGRIDMGEGDDTLDFFLIAQGSRTAEGSLRGGKGSDTLNLGFAFADVTLSETGLSENSYTLTTAGQTLSISGFERITFADGETILGPELF